MLLGCGSGLWPRWVETPSRSETAPTANRFETIVNKETNDPIYTDSISIPFQDIDAAGILFFARLFDHAHQTYERFMAHADHSLADVLARKEYLLPLVHAEADYQAPIRHGEEISIELSVKRLGGRSFTLGYRFVDAAGQLRASAETVHVVIDKDTKAPRDIPSDLRALLVG